MDNLTHTLFAATLARTPLTRAGRGTTVALVLASNAPDIDIVASAGGAVSYLEWHRGPTHGPLGIIGLGIVVAGLVWAGSRLIDRLRDGGGEATRPTSDHARFARLTIISTLCVLLHVLMDLPTSYGTRLLSPFDWHWYAVDLMPIIDVYLITILAACLLFGSRATLSGSRWDARHRNAAIALTLMALNYGVRVVAHHEALAAAPRIFGPTLPERCDAAVPQGPVVDRWPLDRPLSERDRRGRCLVEIAALPSFVSPFQWRLIAYLSNAYETREIELIELRLRAPSSTPEAPWRLVRQVPNHWTPDSMTAAATRTAQVFLGFSRFAAVGSSTDRDEVTTVTWIDMRFTPGPPRRGLNRAEARRAGFFAATVRVGPGGEILDQRLGP